MLPDSHVIDNEGHVTEEANESKSSDGSDVLKFYTSSLSDEIDPRYALKFVFFIIDLLYYSIFCVTTPIKPSDTKDESEDDGKSCLLAVHMLCTHSLRILVPHTPPLFTHPTPHTPSLLTHPHSSHTHTPQRALESPPLIPPYPSTRYWRKKNLLSLRHTLKAWRNRETLSCSKCPVPDKASLQSSKRPYGKMEIMQLSIIMDTLSNVVYMHADKFL